MNDVFLQNRGGIRAAVVLVAGLFAGCATRMRAPVPAHGAAPDDPIVARALADLRAATDRFHDLDSAVAAGYQRTVPECLIHAQHGAMGYHHVNRGYVTAALDVKQPQILLYERLRTGEYRLNGVEFVVPYRLWPRDSVPPLLFGRRLKHEDNLEIWYLHVWAWTENADGIFADFNPTVSCPMDAKIFTPFAVSPD